MAGIFIDLDGIQITSKFKCLLLSSISCENEHYNCYVLVLTKIAMEKR